MICAASFELADMKTVTILFAFDLVVKIVAYFISVDLEYKHVIFDGVSLSSSACAFPFTTFPRTFRSRDVQRKSIIISSNSCGGIVVVEAVMVEIAVGVFVT